jgi:hypothetical protein
MQREKTLVLVNCSFAELQNLSEAATLSCFGAQDVLVKKVTQKHSNFMKTGWDGCILWEALELKKTIYDK